MWFVALVELVLEVISSEMEVRSPEGDTFHVGIKKLRVWMEGESTIQASHPARFLGRGRTLILECAHGSKTLGFFKEYISLSQKVDLVNCLRDLPDTKE